MKLRFVTSVYGARHVNMLLPLLYSIECNSPGANVTVYWEDTNRSTIEVLKKTFPKVVFFETNFRFGTDITQRISSKILTWALAVHQHPHETICLLDTDTLVVRPLIDILRGRSFDILITDRQWHFPINSGVVVAKTSQKVAHFFTRWRKKTQEILASKELYDQSNSLSLPYGGADQMALHLLLNYKYGTTKYTIREVGKRLAVRTVDCRYLNETESRPITKTTHILHYKGGWRSVLFEGGYFTKLRPKQASWKMYTHYIKTFQSAVDEMNRRLGSAYTVRDFGLRIPFYIDPVTIRERPGLYPIYFILAWPRSLPRRVSLLLRERFIERQLQ